MALVEIEQVTKSFTGNAHRAVDGVSLHVDEGETVGIVGESGSGKTTLARMMLGLIPPTSGKVSVAGIDFARANPEELRALRRQMQPVFQDPYGALNPRMKVGEIIAEPLVIHRKALGGLSRMGLHGRVDELLGQVGLDGSARGR